MARRRLKVVEREEELEREEVASEPEQSLDDFVREMFQTTPQAEANGMPSLEWLKEQFKTKSAAIRYLHSQGHKVAAIQKHLGLRYQHVRNVLKTELKRGPNEPFNLTDGISSGIDKV